MNQFLFFEFRKDLVGNVNIINRVLEIRECLNETIDFA